MLIISGSVQEIECFLIIRKGNNYFEKGVCGNSLLPTQCFCKPKTSLKNKMYSLKKQSWTLLQTD